MTAMAEKRRRVGVAGQRTAIYVRISLDRTGAGLGVERQEAACRDKAANKGWNVVEVYVDNDVSATSKKPRPAYQRMLADARAGHIDAIVVWHIDRLTRRPRELEDVIDLADDHGLLLATVEGDVDLATDTGQLTARLLASVARQEAAHKGARQRLQRRQQAEAGKPHRGGPRPYGYLPDRVTPDPREAPFIAEAATRVIAGETLRSVALDMTARGARTVGGKEWSAQTLRQVLRSARISGRREVFDVADKSGMGEIVATDCWQPIITPEQSDTLRTMFANPDRRAHSRSTRARYLLTGLLRCERCGGKLGALAWERGNRYLYRCRPPGSNDAAAQQTCGATSVKMQYADAIVRDVVLEAIDTPDFYDRLYARAEVDPAVQEAINQDEQKLNDLAAMMAEGDLTMAEWKTAREVVQARLDVNKATLARVSNVAAVRLLDGDGTLLEQWERLNWSQRRAVLAEVLEEVRVRPGDGRGKPFNPKRLKPIFRF